jgi:hypothetical protein
MSVATAWMVIPPATRVEFDWLMPAFALIVFALWVVLGQLAANPPDGSVPFLLAVAFLAAGIVVIHAGSARIMNAAIVISSAFAGVAAVAWWRRADASGAIPAAAVMLPGLLLIAQQETFSEIPWYAFVIPAAAPLLLAEAWPMSQWQGFRLKLVRFLLMLLTVLVPLAAAVYLASEAAGPLEY